MKNKLSFIALLALVSILLVADSPDSKVNSTPQNSKIGIPAGWTEPVDIAPGLNYWSYDARVATGKNGVKAYAIWTEEGGGAKRVFFNTNESGKWGNAQNISVYVLGEYPGPEINIDKNGDAVIVYQAKTPSGNYEILSNKRHAGEWEGFENVSKTPTGGSQSPSIMIDPRNNDYYATWQDDVDRPSEEAIFWKGYIQVKRGGTAPWVGAGEILDNTARCYFHDAVMDNKGVAYCVYDDRSDFGIAHVFFTQNATPAQQTGWTQPMDVSGNTAMWDNWGFSYPRLTCDNNGNVYVVWTDNRDGNWEINFRKRINGHWYPRENLSQAPTQSYHPTVAVNKTNGEIYVAWGENLNGNWEIYFREYKKVNRKWGWQPIENFSKNGGTQDFPTLSTDDVGGIHLVYTDNRSGLSHIYYTKKPGSVEVFPPLNLKVVSKLVQSSQSTPSVTKTNTLTWDENPKNAEVVIQKYRIFRKKAGDPDTNFALLAEVEGTLKTYDNTGLPNAQKYTYAVTALAEGGYESPRSNPVTDKDLYPPDPPLNLKAASKLVKPSQSNPSVTKTNTLTWDRNPKNAKVVIQKYRIFRKKAGDPDTNFALLAEVESTVRTYENAGLANAQKYTYAVTSLDEGGIESSRSDPVTDKDLYPPVTYAPRNVTLNTDLDSSQTSKFNKLNWEPNPQNSQLNIINYEIFRKEAQQPNSSYTLLISVSGGVFTYYDPDLLLTKKYKYRLKAVSDWLVESSNSAAVEEIKAFCPLNPSLSVTINSYLFYKEKINTISWKQNPLNEAVTISSYKIYRKKSSESDSSYNLVTTVNGSTFEYKDRKLPINDKYSYRLTAVDSQGNESTPTISMNEQ